MLLIVTDGSPADIDERDPQHLRIDAKKAAEEAMKNKSSDVDYAKAQAELAEAMAQIQAIENLRKIKH